MHCSEARGPELQLRRNINSGGSDPQQGLVDVSCGSPVTLPLAWTVCAFTWSREQKTLSSYLNGEFCAASQVRPLAADDIDVQQNQQSHVLLGGKSDSPSHCLRDGAVSHVLCLQSCLPAEAIRELAAQIDTVDGPIQSWAVEAAACSSLSEPLPQRSDDKTN